MSTPRSFKDLPDWLRFLIRTVQVLASLTTAGAVFLTTASISPLHDWAQTGRYARPSQVSGWSLLAAVGVPVVIAVASVSLLVTVHRAARKALNEPTSEDS